MQSHLVRAPLANMLPLTELLQSNELTPEEKQELLSYLEASSDQPDAVIRNITDLTIQVADSAKLLDN